jgi:hypothetical protein
MEDIKTLAEVRWERGFAAAIAAMACFGLGVQLRSSRTYPFWGISFWGISSNSSAILRSKLTFFSRSSPRNRKRNNF